MISHYNDNEISLSVSMEDLPMSKPMDSRAVMTPKTQKKGHTQIVIIGSANSKVLPVDIFFFHCAILISDCAIKWTFLCKRHFLFVPFNRALEQKL